MFEDNLVLIKMDSLIKQWEEANDHRMIFLQCYRMMTHNILSATHGGYFEDNDWVNRLMENFAGYYFNAQEAFGCDGVDLPAPWRIAFQATADPRTHVLQNLGLGINAHINYDLVFALSDVLGPEWKPFPPEDRQKRYRDHCRVNDIISQTIDSVQDQVVDRFAPAFGTVDVLLGPIDEWMASWFVSKWREEVWEHALQIIETDDNHRQLAVTQQVEKIAITRARDILGHGRFLEFFEFL